MSSSLSLFSRLNITEKILNFKNLLNLVKKKIIQVLNIRKRHVRARKNSYGQINDYHNEEQYDQLTNLLTRSCFSKRISTALVNAQDKQKQMALMLIDLDRFKKINDTLGCQQADQVLKLFIQRITSCLEPKDICGRWGGDEVAILLRNIAGEEEVAQFGRKIIDSLQRPLEVSGYQIYLHVSIGIAMYPQDAPTEDLLTQKADVALSTVKKQGKNNFQFYHSELSKNRIKRLTLENCLHSALSNQELSLHYQPKLNLGTGEIYGVEALLRWHNPILGQVSPYEFIPIAEEIGLMDKLGNWVLENAIAQSLAWQKAGLPKLQMSINVSPVQLKNSNFASQLENILQQTGFPAHLIDLEITENCLMEDIESIHDHLDQIIGTGVRMSLDDFGIGYSSLAYLKKFSFHNLKIDQSFVRNLNYSPRDGVLISAIVSIAQNFNMQVIAEGAESREHVKLLASLGCDCFQGYWLSKPLPPPQVEEFIRNYKDSEQAKEAQAIINKYKNKPPLYLIA